MAKMNISIPRMGRNPKLVNTVCNISVHLNGILTHGHMYGGFRHFGIPYLDGGSNCNVSPIYLFMWMLEDLVVYEFGHLFYDKGSSMHPFA